MNSNQIRRVLRGRAKCFIGVYPADHLTKLATHLRKLKKFKTKPVAFILNTQPSWMAGEHWLAFHLPPLNRNEPIQVFDSFGHNRRQRHASFIHTDYFTQFIRAMTLMRSHRHQQQQQQRSKPKSIPAAYHINRQRLQSKTTAVCGYYSCVFILHRCHGTPFAKILRNMMKYGSGYAMRDKQIIRVFKALLWRNVRGKMPHEQEPAATTTTTNTEAARGGRAASFRFQTCTSMNNCR